MPVKKVILSIFFAISTFAFAIGQSDSLCLKADSIETPNLISRLGLDRSLQGDELTSFKATRFIAPAALISYGFALHYIPALKDLDRDIRKGVQKNINFNTRIDDVLVLTPAMTVFALDWCGVPARHSFKDRVIVTASSYAMGLTSTLLAKEITDRWRPDMSEENSFPSGHAMSVFAGAHLLMKEYGHISPWISVSGYAMASGVGFLRIANNRHWFSDVIVGAGFGILSVELSYLLLPYLSKTFTIKQKKKMSELTVNPDFGNNWAGMGFRYSF
ncbi:phosphatase PAP2 family protein [Dysgonomonas sp. 520]|uniref:phosphatase PAP2 family protein n=1 Tax=Dysgonomonas sp. 520 TaxID=2302931 RepID=UPI0013D87E71|nr:phosphatase PAP2 family protein [Dysgonomonas sp. 520]NDW10070.1 PAP2 family protein [Dysgonomonas sp. 520]